MQKLHISLPSEDGAIFRCGKFSNVLQFMTVVEIQILAEKILGNAGSPQRELISLQYDDELWEKDDDKRHGPASKRLHQRNVLKSMNHPLAGDDESSIVTITCYASSLLPAWFPLVFLFQWMLFWIPYPDFGRSTTLALDLAKQFRQEAERGNWSMSRVTVQEHGALGFLGRWGPIATLSVAFSPQTRFFLAYMAAPAFGAFLLVLKSGVVKF